MGTSISQIITVTTAGNVGVGPGPAGTITITNPTSVSATLSWTAPVVGTPPFNYRVQQAPAGANPVWADTGVLIPGLTETITGLVANTSYQFRVVVSNAVSNNFSPVAQFTTTVIAPDAPTALQAVPGNGQVSLSFAESDMGTPPITYNTLYRITPQSVVIPPQAAAAGYTVPTYGPHLVLNKTTTSPVTSLPTFTGNTNIVPFTFFGTSWTNIGCVQNPDGSITMDGTGQAFGNGLSSAAQGQFGTGRLNFTGTAFGGGGFFEAVVKTTGPASFWSNDLESMNGGSLGLGNNQWPGQVAGYRDSIEGDFMEFDNTNRYGWSIHNWYNSTSDVAPNWGGPIGIPSATPTGDPWSPPPGVDFTQYNKYGMLWVPATNTAPGYIQIYFNDVPVGIKMQWNKYNPALPPPPVAGAVTITGSAFGASTGFTAPSTAWSVIDTLHLVLILGGGDGLTTVQSMTVWQASGAGNLIGTGL